MQIEELLELGEWFTGNVNPIIKKYVALHNAVNHNASQPDKQPVTPLLEELLSDLSLLSLDQLTSEQIGELEELEVDNFLGNIGVTFVTEIVTSSNYDPVTAAQSLKEAHQKLSEVSTRFNSIVTALKEIGYTDTHFEPSGESSVIRIHFQEGASMSDVADWKKWTNDWYDIVRGVGMAVKETPNHTKVIGAANGSVIMVLSGTLAFTGLLACIALNLSKILKAGLEIANSIEDLRHKKHLNQTIESALEAQRKQIEDDGVKSTVTLAKESLGRKIDGAIETALKKAIEKYFNFHSKGGEVDIITPIEDSDDGDEPISAQIRSLHDTVSEIRQATESIKLLTHNLDQK